LSIGPIDKESKDVPVKPIMLTNKGLQALLRVERLMDEASHALGSNGPAPSGPAAAIQTPVTTERAENRIGTVAANGK
jgi:hypothetical protein